LPNCAAQDENTAFIGHGFTWLYTVLHARLLCTQLHVRVGHALLEAAEGERRCGRHERREGGAAGERAVDLRRKR
jgi:hypothetical protein